MTSGTGAEATNQPVHVVLVEDHAVFRQALALTFGLEPDIRVVADAGTIRDALAAITTEPVIDVAVVDLDLPDGHGADLIRTLRRRHPVAQALVLTASTGRVDLTRAVAAGAAGVIHKSTPLPEILAAVRRLAAGEWLLSPQELTVLLHEAREDQARSQATRLAVGRLTRREHDVLGLLAQGMSDRQIAAQLSVGKDTVHTHMVNLMQKLGAESRLQALIVAIRHGVISIEDQARD